jgi:hypothetical protein
MTQMISLVLTLLMLNSATARAGAGSPGHRQGDQAQFTIAKLAVLESDRVLRIAEKYLYEPPLTITEYICPRSAGGLHEFYSEGDYWWPDPANPDGPYLQRDGMSNPENFTKHREMMMRFSAAVSSLTAAYKLTRDEQYAAHAVRHLKAWFVDESSMMVPHLKYAQAIKGRVTGRGIGIIDTIHLIEVARAVEVLSGSTSFSPAEVHAVKDWFAGYLIWLTKHQYGIDEREAKNNHGTWWVTQVAAFAHLVGDTVAMNYCRERFITVLLPGQMAGDGSFPLELKRTKPYNYSIFNLEGMATICQILSIPGMNLWDTMLPDGRSMRKAMEFLYPYLKNRSSWPYARDVAYFEDYPVRHHFLLFAGAAFKKPAYLELWKTLEPDPGVPEVIRSMPLRQPVLWVE